jgi:hypothetical protein
MMNLRPPSAFVRGDSVGTRDEHWADSGLTKLVNLIAVCGVRIEGDADAPRFIRPDGKGIETAPCARQASTPVALAAQNARFGLEIHAKTAMTGWGGEGADDTHMLPILGQDDAEAHQSL